MGPEGPGSLWCVSLRFSSQSHWCATDKVAERQWSVQVRSEQQRAKEEAEKKLQKYIRQLDHFERARREEEAPLIQQAHEKQVGPLDLLRPGWRYVKKECCKLPVQCVWLSETELTHPRLRLIVPAWLSLTIWSQGESGKL